MIRNIFADLPEPASEEALDTLLSGDACKLERIVSLGHASPPGFWYDQSWDEWVILLSGHARLLFDGETQARELHPGDFLSIPAHKRHRVEWTDPSAPSVWLALHYQHDPAR
jgi:cupin 2 domain-containing protein